MNRTRTLVLVGLTVFAIAGCKREAEAPPPVESTAAPTEEIKSAVISEVDHGSPVSASPPVMHMRTGKVCCCVANHCANWLP